MLSHDELTRLIEAQGESPNLDGKAPMLWDGGVNSACLAKDIVAFANSRDGGAIVIGKSEPVAGRFDLVGLNEADAQSFDSTKVSDWVNARFSPPVELVCQQHEHPKGRFVVIVVSEFRDVPILCTKQFDDPKDSKKPLLRKTAIYVRTLNAASAPLSSVDELRELIGLATRKRGNELLALFDATMRGRPLVPEASVEEKFTVEAERLRRELGILDNPKFIAGCWHFTFFPSRSSSQRWPDRSAMEAAIRKNSVRFQEEFPGNRNGMHAREWGIANDTYGDVWSLSELGLFLFSDAYRENEYAYQSPWRDIQTNEPYIIPKGEWFEFGLAIRQIFLCFAFMSRFVDQFEPDEDVGFEIVATRIGGRLLASVDPQIELGRFGFLDEKCRAKEFRFRGTCSVAEIRANWRDQCAGCMKKLVELFPGHQISLGTLAKCVVDFEGKKR